jgi:hypothetical protein
MGLYTTLTQAKSANAKNLAADLGVNWFNLFF